MASTLARVALAVCLAPVIVQADIQVGIGIGDITGPVADVHMMVRRSVATWGRRWDYTQPLLECSALE
jgi:hypothetical protein